MPRVQKPKFAACEFCGESFDIAKRHKPANNPGQYCSRECSDAARKASGFFRQVLSPAGIAAQMAYKAKHGKAPGKRGGARPPRGSTKKMHAL